MGSMVRAGIAGLWLALAGVLPGLAAEPLRLIYPRASQGNDPRVEYPLGLLRLAFAKTGIEVDLRPSDLTMEIGRQVQALESGRGLDILWSGLSVEWERRLLPVYVPMYRGMLGMRVMAVRAGDPIPDWSKLRTLEDIRGLDLTFGQGVGWPAVAILRANGLSVSETAYDRLYDQLSGGRVAAIPRGFMELLPEIAGRPGIAPEAGLMLVYRHDNLFYLRQGADEVARRLRIGLDVALADGSFDRHLMQDPAVRQALTALNIPDRHVIRLENPLLSAPARMIPESHWLKPETLKALAQGGPS